MVMSLAMGAAEKCGQLSAWYNDLVATNASDTEFRDWLELATGEILLNPSQINLTSPYSFEKEAVREFLSPYRGPVWRVIFKLLEEESPAACSIPVTYLPVAQARPPGIHTVQMRPLEYYLTSFFLHLSVGSGGNVQANDVYDCPYISVLNDLIAFFLPVDGPFPVQSILHGSDAGVRSSSSDAGSGISQRISTPLGLLKKTFLSQEPHPGNERVPSTIHSTFRINETLDKTWTFVKIFSEIILNCPWSKTEWMNRSELPSTFWISVGRHTMKNILRFCFSPTSVGSPALKRMKAAMIPRLVHKELLDFLQHLFLHWPLDASFRAAMEMWFSFIQPWRYTGEPISGSLRRYEHFMVDNSEFYTLLFQSCLTRFLRMDMDSPRNVFLLSRLVKVVSQPDFVQQVHLLSHNESSEHQSMNSLNGSSGYGMEALWEKLYRQASMAEAHSSLRLQMAEMNQKEASAKASWWERIFGQAENGAMAADRKLRKDLQWISATLAHTFHFSPKLQDAEWEGHSTVGITPSPMQQGSPYKAYPDSQWDSTGIFLQLTPTGRNQVKNRLRHYNFEEASSRAVPQDLAPIRKSENASLLRLLYKLAGMINHPLSDTFTNLWKNEGVVGKVCRKVLLPPTFGIPVEGPQVSTFPSLPPRLSFRALASYRTLFYLFILAVLFMLLIR